MRQGDELYGVLVSGEHRLYVRPKGKPGFHAGNANFTRLMLVTDGA
jgi:hypothetical protein